MKVGQISRRTHKLLVISIISSKLDFLEKFHLIFFVAEILRQIMLKFQIFQINSFEDITGGLKR